MKGSAINNDIKRTDGNGLSLSPQTRMCGPPKYNEITDRRDFIQSF